MTSVAARIVSCTLAIGGELTPDGEHGQGQCGLVLAGTDLLGAAAEMHPMAEAAARFLPRLHPDPVRMDAFTDLYADDGVPLLGRVPGAERLITATAFSGRGFKLAPTIRGEVANIVRGRPHPRPGVLLAVIAAHSGDEVRRRRAHRAITDHADALPQWLADRPALHRRPTARGSTPRRSRPVSFRRCTSPRPEPGPCRPS
ncbi:FAD-dependent oxidoreductase [Pseudonocardia sp. GCM10023141]|uniref:FAD-dependent oxidoreductase n=1 Tax=Pseudonocardia sp. GCM10023141 TaxID=3252653 RepID=UPI00361060A9